MRDFCNRQSFCEVLSDAISKHLNVQLQKNESVDVCLIQRTMHPAKRKRNGFSVTKNMIALLSQKFGYHDSQDFQTIMESSLSAVLKESQSWNIQVAKWRRENENYVIDVDKASCFRFVLQGIFQHNRDFPVAGERVCNILCHVSKEPTLADLRSLLYCSLLKYHCKCSPAKSIILSSDGKPDQQKFRILLKDTSLDEKRFCFFKDGCAEDLFHHHKLPQSFFDCLSRDSDETFHHLAALQRQDNGTAFHSRLSCHYKNITCAAARQTTERLSPEPRFWIHVCSQKNHFQAQQSELFYAWCKDTVFCFGQDGEKSDAQCDSYLCHAGIQGHAELDVATFMELRRKQIKASFEAKLQVNLEGEDWDSVFCKMRTAVIKLEFFHYSSSSKIKLSNDTTSLPICATFILYNYSRLCMLLDSHSTKVEEGHYPRLCEFDEVDFSSLVEDAEWELLIDHLWNFRDIISKPLVSSLEGKAKINCHQVVNYLHQLCRSVSALYSRHHILGENLPHLVPVMNARIYLMKAAKKAMSEVFYMLGVEPLTQM